MKHLKVFSCLLLFLLAVPAFADGVVYVPIADNFTLGGIQYRTWVWVSNDDAENLGFVEHHLIPTFTDGTDRENVEPIPVFVGAQQTMILQVPAIAGMLEVYASTNVSVHARLVQVTKDPARYQGIRLPVISSENMVPAGQEAHLLGWERRGKGGAEARSSFGLVNLGHQEIECNVSLFKVSGEVVAEDLILTFAPLSLNRFDDALGALGDNDASNWRMSISCDQPSFPFLGVHYGETGNIVFIGPAQSGESELQRPGSGGVSDQFDYLSDMPIHRWGGIELRPFVDSTGINFHGGSGNTVVGGFAPIKIGGTTYEKGISFYGKWSTTPFVEFKLDGKYAVFTAVVRIDDYARGRYEWAIVQGGRWIRLERPPDGFRGRERGSWVRVGSSCTFQVKGDGKTLFAGPAIFAHRDAVLVEIDVTGVQTLRLQTHPDGIEVRDAPYRNGLSKDTIVQKPPWWDLISFADAKLFYPN